MGVEVILKLASIGILVSIVAQILKQIGKEEIATLTTMAGVIVVLMIVVDMISELLNTVQNIFSLY